MHVAIIMNGNRQWALRRGGPLNAGHAKGVAALRDTVMLAADSGVATLTLYAICTAGCGRASQEVDSDLSVLGSYLTNDARTRPDGSVQISVIGNSDWLATVLPEAIYHKAHSRSAGSRMHLRIVVDYSAHDNAIRTAWCSSRARPLQSFNEQLTEIDPTAVHAGPADLLVRTGAATDLSDFMLWEVAYARLHQVNCLWPDFGAHDFRSVLAHLADSKGLPAPDEPTVAARIVHTLRNACRRVSRL